MSKKQKSAIIVGWINKKGAANCGETMKNQLLIERLRELGVKCYLADFYQWKRHPWVFIQLLYFLLFHKSASIIFSTSIQNIYPLMKFLKKFHIHRNIIHWVIGGSLGKNTRQQMFDPEILNVASFTLVETKIMVDELKLLGVRNVIEVPNFKPISYIPKLGIASEIKKFVFLSRIMAEKGCDYIIEAAKILNMEGLTNSYIIDFYGKVDERYHDIFNDKISSITNVSYKGFLNLREPEGYDKLASCDALLFPTYWRGEGFAGIFIDAFIAGLPILASDWAHNRCILEEGKTALFYPVHNVNALASVMRKIILNEIDINEMKTQAYYKKAFYNSENVLTKELFEKINLL